MRQSRKLLSPVSRATRTGEVERTVWPVAVEALEICGAHTRDLTTAPDEILLGAHGVTLSPRVRATVR